MRVLVTGGAGFIGSWTVEALVALVGHHRVNVGTGRETSLLELRAAIAEVADRDLPYVLHAAAPGDVRRSCADVRRLRDLLGVTCIVTVRDGLAALFHGAHARAA